MKFIKLKTGRREEVSIRLSTIKAVINSGMNMGLETFTIRTTNRSYYIRDERYTYDSFIDMLNKEYGFENFDK